MKYKIKTLSPLHIGGKEQELTPFEYVIHKKILYKINEDLLSKKLAEKGLLNRFLEKFVSFGRDFKLTLFLKESNLLDEEFLNNISSYCCECRTYIEKEPVRPIIRNGLSEPFIPGSSIKGALRTALMYVILKRIDKNRKERLLDDFVIKKIEEYQNDPRGKRGFYWFKERFKQRFSEKLTTDIFQRFKIADNQRYYGPNSDILRVLKISDTNSISKNECKIKEIKIYSAFSRESPKRFSMFAECIPHNKEFNFELNIDDKIEDYFLKRNSSTSFGMSMNELFKIIRNPIDASKEMTDDILNYEKDFFNLELDISEAINFGNEIPNFRLGWGSGLLFTSVFFLLKKELQTKIRNIFFTDRGDAPAPKSRRIVIDDYNLNSLGFLKVYH